MKLREKIPELELNWELAVDMLTRFIRTEVERVGFNKVVVGLSGGVDSALSTVLAVKALGADNVIPIKMPYSSSSSSSQEDANKLIEKFGLNAYNIDISAAVEEFFNLQPDMDAIRKGNVMARVRMIILFDSAAKYNALVLGTGNKTETLLGYSTWYGDGACSLNPIGDLYKSQVWALAEYLDIPESIINKDPSADLWVGQTDEGELGISYSAADKILYRLIDKRLTEKQIVEEGFDSETIRKILNRVKKFHYKRVIPPVAKMSPRTIGKDFLQSRDWGS